MLVTNGLAQDRRITALQLIRKAGAITRSDLALRLGLSASQVSRITGELLEAGLIVDAGRSASAGGRPSDLLALAPDAAYVVGLDVGSHEQRGGRQPARRDRCAAGRAGPGVREPRGDPRADLGLTDAATARARVAPEAILGVGMALHAFVDPKAGVIRFWSGVPLATSPWTDFAVAEAVGASNPQWIIAVDDVMRTLAISEARYGRDEHDFALVLADEGIAAAFVIDGAPYIGPNNVAGEIGHIAIDGDDTPCECGNVGCLELRASARAILARADQWLRETQMHTTLRSHAALDIDTVLDAAEHGDRLAYQLIVEAGEALGRGLAVLLNLLGPRLIVLTGALARSAIYCDAARRMMKLRSLSHASQQVRLETGLLDALAGARGAASLVLDRLFSARDTNILALRRRSAA